MKTKKILLTGGGTAGHVTPNIALLPALAAEGFDIAYAGSFTGIEKDLIEKEHIPYYGISAGKLRRYADLKNITDLFRVVKGLGDALGLMRRLKPDIIFSKGGFVTVPVVIAARLCGIPAVLHESDITPGLANRLALPFARAVCVNFPETMLKIPARKAVLTGTPIRSALLKGTRFSGEAICGFDARTLHKPTVLFTGGSQGAKAINDCVIKALPTLCARYRVIHLCGKGHKPDLTLTGYAPFEYVSEELPHLMTLADVVVSRAGANTIFELLALQKPNILIPLTKEASRGDQILNAESFHKQGFSLVLPEENMTEETLLTAIDLVYKDRQKYIQRMQNGTRYTGDGATDALNAVMSVIRSHLK